MLSSFAEWASIGFLTATERLNVTEFLSRIGILGDGKFFDHGQ